MRVDSHLLDNGLRVEVAAIPSCGSLCIHAAVRSGVIYENASFCGVSHLLEHLHASQSAGHHESKRSNSNVLRTCATFDAWLELDSSHYSITTTEEHVVSACEQLNFGLSRLSISDELLESEKGVLAVEVEPTKGHDFLSAIYEKIVPGTPYGLPTGGRRKTIVKLTRKTVDEYDHLFYDPRNISVGIAGSINSQKLSAILSAFDSMPKSSNWRPITHPKYTPNCGHISSWSTASGECVLVCAIQPSASYEDLLCLRVIATGLELSSSPLFMKLRAARPCYYEFDARIDYLGEWCFLIVRCEAEWSRQSSAIVAIAEALADISKCSNKELIDVWLEEAKQIFLHLADVSVMPVSARAYQIALPHVASSGKRYSRLESEVEIVRALSIGKIKSVFNTVFGLSNLSVIIDGPRLPGQSLLLSKSLRRTLVKA